MRRQWRQIKSPTVVNSRAPGTNYESLVDVRDLGMVA